VNLTPWIVFTLGVLVLMAIDLFVVHRRPHEVSTREALISAAVWIAIAAVFALGIGFFRGHTPALEFTTAYLIELGLSLDNLFVFMLIFRYFRVPAHLQHRVLFWGILGALVMRLGFIVLGVALLHRFHWVIYVFGAILVWSGIQMARGHATDVRPERSMALRLLRRFVPITRRYVGHHFFWRRMGRTFATPLFVVLVLVETTDLVFAVDSIPAVLAISKDPFIVYTSNVFAILGLRTLFFALERLLRLFQGLNVGLALILAFVGVKMLLSDLVHIPIGVTLGVVSGVIAASIGMSYLRPRTPAPPSS